MAIQIIVSACVELDDFTAMIHGKSLSTFKDKFECLMRLLYIKKYDNTYEKLSVVYNDDKIAFEKEEKATIKV